MEVYDWGWQLYTSLWKGPGSLNGWDWIKLMNVSFAAAFETVPTFWVHNEIQLKIMRLFSGE